ncbi:MAG: hypothetical protein LBS53_04975 [Synergistaceae bacterium]|nr:hypothetical protein [Synergistaceae bacterium]
MRAMKGLNGGKGAVFPIRLDDMSVVGYMRAIDASILDDGDLIARMAEARTRYKTCFLTQFDVTPRNKREWLENDILENDRRLLFLVEAGDHTIVGQDGFTLLDGGVFSLDGTMRWLKYGHRDLYVRCGVERAAICFFQLGGRLSTTEVFKDNVPNVKNSLKMGFSVIKEHRLFLSEGDGLLRYEKIDDGTPSNTDRTLLSFAMTREFFIKRYPEITASFEVLP